jgi:hypothetical protein
MAAIKSYNMVSTGSITIPVDLATATPDIVYENNIITGSVTLAATVSVVAGGTPSKGQKIRIYWDAVVHAATFDVNVLGTNLPTNAIKVGKFAIECLYDGTAWVVDTRAIILEADSVVTTAIADDNVTNDKLANMTRGTIKVGGTANAPTDLDAKTSGQILVGDGTDVASVAVSGDLTLASTGVATISAGVVTPVEASASVNQRQFTVELEGDSAGKIGAIKYPMCLPVGGSCTVNAIYATVKQVPATDTFTIVAKNNSSTLMTGSQMDITTALLLGNVVAVTPTANNTFTNSGSPVYITLETSKTTAEACIVDITVCYTITA